MNRRALLSMSAAVVLLPLSAMTAALAAERVDYTDEAFNAAKASGRPILVDVWASWCPTCKAQHFVFQDLFKDDKYKNLLVLKVDFDAQDDIVRRFKAPGQSTLIVYKGDQELGRSVGDTNPNTIRALIDSAY